MTTTARKMEQALQGWRDCYQIEEEAFTQLRSLLQSFGIPIQFVHSTDGGNGNRILPESSTVDLSVFNAGPLESGITSRYSHEALFSNQAVSARPFESAIPSQEFSNHLFGQGITNEGLSGEDHSAGLFDMGTSNAESSRQGLRHWQNNKTSVYTGGLDFLAFTNRDLPTESLQQGDPIARDQLCDITAEDFHSAALAASQPMSESSSRPRPCIRCWKRKLRVHPVSLFKRSLTNQ